MKEHILFVEPNITGNVMQNYIWRVYFQKESQFIFKEIDFSPYRGINYGIYVTLIFCFHINMTVEMSKIKSFPNLLLAILLFKTCLAQKVHQLDAWTFCSRQTMGIICLQQPPCEYVTIFLYLNKTIPCVHMKAIHPLWESQKCTRVTHYGII